MLVRAAITNDGRDGQCNCAADGLVSIAALAGDIAAAGVVAARAVRIILCGLSVAPDDGDLRPILVVAQRLATLGWCDSSTSIRGVDNTRSGLDGIVSV
jgi:hypothetical protein